VERLSEKGFERPSERGFGRRIGRKRGLTRHLSVSRGPVSGTSWAFRTVSEGVFSEVRRHGVLRTSRVGSSQKFARKA
jgi:hypothetical protein